MISIRFASALLLTALVIAGCSDNENKADRTAGAKQDSSSARLPEACRGEDGAPSTTALSSQCADEIFSARVAEQGSKALRKMSVDQQLGFGHGMCAYAQSLVSSGAPKPTYEELVESTSQSWKVDRSIVDEIVKLGEVLCPEAMKVITGLPPSSELPVLGIAVTGSGTGAVTFTLPDGKPLTENVEGGWAQTIELREPYDFNMSVQPTSEGSLGCEVRVGDEVISSAKVDPGSGTASCAASVSEIRDAARGGD